MSAGQPVVLVPTNRGLAAQAKRALTALGCAGGDHRFVRGEDVPYIASRIASGGRSVLGVTGEDLMAEWLAAGNQLDRGLRRSVFPWSDPRAAYGKPALCLIGPPRSEVGLVSRVAVCTKYWHLADSFLRSLEAPVRRIERIPIAGALETVCLTGLADFIIDIVVTGETMRRAGLVVYEVIRTSDLALLEAP
jgi:ATP phosphoribosyltransferase